MILTYYIKTYSQEYSPDVFGDVATETLRWHVNKFNLLFCGTLHLQTYDHVFVST